VINILLNLDMNNFSYWYFKSNITEENWESLRFDWSVSARRVFRHVVMDVSCTSYEFSQKKPSGTP
jgi:hypothetical protein